MNLNELLIAQLNRQLNVTRENPGLAFEIGTAFKKVEFHITVSQPGAPMMGPLKLNETNGFSADVTHHSNSKQTMTFDVKYITIVSPYPPIEKTCKVIVKKPSTPSAMKFVISNVASMFDNQEFSDFKFIINNKEFNVHKAILAGASDSFVQIFRVNGQSHKINDIRRFSDTCCDSSTLAKPRRTWMKSLSSFTRLQAVTRLIN
jgi:hypothetical protein